MTKDEVMKIQNPENHFIQMDKQIQKLKDTVDNFLHRSREDIMKEWGEPLKHLKTKCGFIINTAGEFLKTRSHLFSRKML